MYETSRRAFLSRLSAVGCVALRSRSKSIAQPVVNPRRIDVHHHFTPPSYLQFLKAHNQGGGGVPGGRGDLIGAYAGWTLAEDLEDMVYFGERDAVRKVVRESNEYSAKLRSDHKGRFGSFAALPATDTDGALREMEYVLDTLKADGIGLFSNYGDIWLGDETLKPLHEELNRRKAVVYVHPIEGNCCRNIVKDVTDTVVEYGADTTRTIASLIFSGTTTHYPEITWIFSHAGGMMPFVIERFVSGTVVEIVPGIQTKGQGTIPPAKVAKGVLYELRRMYYDTAQATNPVAMDALRKVVPVSQIVYGTDYWYRSAQETARGLVTNRVFSAEELQAVNRGNASRILPRYRT